MKKILALFTIFALIFAACTNPMKVVNDVLQQTQKPYAKNIEYTLTTDDYETIAKVSLVAAETAEDSAACEAIGTYHSFAETRPAAKYVPPFLSYKFPALDSGSIAKITYNFDHTYIFSYNEVITIPQAVYDAIGAEAFDAYNNKPGDIIPTYLDTTVTDYTRIVAKFRYVDPETSDTIYTMMYFVNEGDGFYAPDDQYVLQDADYELVGGTAARYHNFSSSYPPNDYIPNILKLRFPLALAGDVKEVIYKYYSGYVQTHYNKYFFDGTNWNALEVKTDQFIHNGEKWVFDPTVKFTMSCSDYQIIVEWVQANKPNYMHPVYNNTEYYFGASSYYCNFDMRLTTRRQYDADNLLPADDQEAMRVLWQRMDDAIRILLENKFPDAQPFVNGIPVYYEVTFDTYEPERHKYMIKFLCTDVGQFTPVDQDGAIEYNSHIILVQ